MTEDGDRFEFRSWRDFLCAALAALGGAAFACTVAGIVLFIQLKGPQ